MRAEAEACRIRWVHLRFDPLPCLRIRFTEDVSQPTGDPGMIAT
jgi:hypothetical protein